MHLTEKCYTVFALIKTSRWSWRNLLPQATGPTLGLMLNAIWFHALILLHNTSPSCPESNVEHHPQPELSGVIATGVDIISTHADSTRIYADITKRYGDRATVLDFPSVTAIHAPQASKGKALQQLAAKLGTEQTDVLAIGDSVNDVSMLEWAGHGATPEHCDHYARAAADQILSGKNVDGVVKLLQIVLADTLS